MSADTIFQRRRYLHFDEPIGEKASRALATEPERVQSWAFMPMLKTVMVTKKIKWNKDGKLLIRLKNRDICYSAHKDAAIYAYYGYVLSTLYEKRLNDTGLSTVVTAFRPQSGNCNIQFAKEVFDWIRAKGECTALAFDIKSFFDTLDHHILKAHWAAILGNHNLPDDHYAVFKSLTKFAWVLRERALAALGISKHKPRANGRRRLCTPEEFREKIRKNGLIEHNQNAFGIPQGSPMSAVLSNIYMLEFDTVVQKKVDSLGGLYRRYCDDMLCIVKPQNAEEVERFVMGKIGEIKLTIQEAKTMRHHFTCKEGVLTVDNPLQYLGFLFDGRRVLLRNAGLSRYYSRMRAAVRLAVATKAKADRKLSDVERKKSLLKRKKLNTRYSYLGGRNFISYAVRASEEFGGDTIKGQIKRHWHKLNQAVKEARGKDIDRLEKLGV